MTEGLLLDKGYKRHGWGLDTKGKVVILDNRDSFVFNLAHRLFEVGCTPAVVRSDAIDLETLKRWEPAALIVSPGPGHPDEAGISVPAIRHFAASIPILGVCLGHQAIALAFGGRVDQGGRPAHGVATRVDCANHALFDGLPNGFSAGRYHSLVATELPDELIACAWSDDFIMALRHRRWPIFGVQFHPESVLTPGGTRLLANFLEISGL